MSDFEGKAGFASTPGGCSKREVCAVVCVPYPQASSPLFEFAIFVLSTTLACLCGSCCLAMMYLLMAIPLALYAMSYPAGKLIALRSEASHEAGEIPALTQLRAIIMLQLRISCRARAWYIRHFRALLPPLIQTIFCILAVDFPVFPRRFSKTREFGTSLMDLGVGAVVLSGALTLMSKTRTLITPPLASALTGGSLSRRACHVVKRQLPLLTLGLCRILLVKASDYHNAAHEYGVHW
ncbi:MAG: hypothetical protein SGPRY_008701 [Prymnesium sp.]